jgi:hypothetical protein
MGIQSVLEIPFTKFDQYFCRIGPIIIGCMGSQEVENPCKRPTVMNYQAKGHIHLSQ